MKNKNKKSYSDKLPRQIGGVPFNNFVCQALDGNGNRCKNAADFEIYYHGDNEIYSFLNYNRNGPSWICVNLCEKCAGDDVKKTYKL